MGQKVNPILFRINNGYRKGWHSNWYSESDNYSKSVIQDLKIQEYFKQYYSLYAISHIEIERILEKSTKIIIFSAKVGVLIGKQGETIVKIENDLKKILSSQLKIDVKEVRRSNLDANIVGRLIADRLEKRQSFKRVVKFAIENAIKSGAVGIKVIVSGRLNGAEIARSETFKEGMVPLQTIRSSIDYAVQEALTIYGIIGVRVWICKKR